MSMQDEKVILGDSENDTSKSGAQFNQIHDTLQKRICFWAYLLLVSLFFAGMIAIASNAWSPMQNHSTSQSFYYANQVAFEWTLGFIEAIIITNTDECPDEYSHAINYEWSGTGYGCYCSIGQSVSFVLEGYCSAALIQTNCINIPSKDPIVSNIWANSSNICIKRSSVSFANQEKYDNSGNYKLCGSSSSLVIMPMVKACPIVNISFSKFSLQNNTATIPDLQSVLPPLYSAFNSTSPYSFYSYPVIKFKVSEYEFCLMDQDTGIDPQHSDFILLKKLKGCSDPGNYSELGSLSQIMFYMNNPKMNALSENGGFPKPSNWDYKLGFGNLPSWTYQCRHNYDSKFSVKQAINQLNFTFFSSYRVAVILLICALGAIGGEVFVLFIQRCFNSSVYPTGYKQYYLPMQFCKALSRYIFDFVCKLLTLGLVLYLCWSSYYNWNWFKGVANFNCYSSHPDIQTKIVQPYTQLYLVQFNFSIAMTIITVFMTIIDIIHFFYIYNHELQYYLVETKRKILVKQTQAEDLKWMDQKLNHNPIDNIEDNHNEDQFKITMAHNMFMHEEQPLKNQQRPKKKKKKRTNLLMRSNNNQSQQYKFDKTAQLPSAFKPYELEDPSVFNMDSIMSPTQKPGGQSSRRRRK